jgi:hypothetical protein
LADIEPGDDLRGVSVARTKFSWANLPPHALKALAASEEVALDDVPKTLRSLYGARPDDDFVWENWDILRESWFFRDVRARRHLVEQLWALGLGRTDSYPKGKAAEMEYVRSRRKSGRLRLLVLEHLIAQGGIDRVNETQATKSAQRATASPPTSITPPGFGDVTRVVAYLTKEATGKNPGRPGSVRW